MIAWGVPRVKRNLALAKRLGAAIFPRADWVLGGEIGRVYTIPGNEHKKIAGISPRPLCYYQASKILSGP